MHKLLLANFKLSVYCENQISNSGFIKPCKCTKNTHNLDGW